METIDCLSATIESDDGGDARGFFVVADAFSSSLPIVYHEKEKTLNPL